MQARQELEQHTAQEFVALLLGSRSNGSSTKYGPKSTPQFHANEALKLARCMNDAFLSAGLSVQPHGLYSAPADTRSLLAVRYAVLILTAASLC